MREPEQAGLCFAALLLALGVTAPRAAGAQDQSDLRRLAYVPGNCDRLMIAGVESASCHGPLARISYAGGRSSFAFFADEGVISFSGLDQHAAGDQTRLVIDRVSIAVRGDPVRVQEALGMCEFGDVEARPAGIACAAEATDGNYIGIFSSDGQPARVEEFGDD